MFLLKKIFEIKKFAFFTEIAVILGLLI